MTRVTVKEIAQEAGVSVATVSRVINQNGRFSKETERRVKKAIKKYHYRPNQLAKGLRQNKIDAIGVIVPNIANEFFSSLVLVMQDAFFEAGYATIIYNTSGSVDMERQCHRQLSAQSVAGVISVNSVEDVRSAFKRIIPTVYIDRFLPDNARNENVASISSDNVHSGALAAQVLLQGGCKNPIMIATEPNVAVTKMRIDGFVSVLQEAGISAGVNSLVQVSAATLDCGRGAVRSLLSKKHPFDGIFCLNDWLAMGVLEALHEAEIRVPDDIAVVGHDDITVAQFGRPPLTTIHQDSNRIGLEAAETMLRLIDARPLEQRHITVPVELVKRKSTK